MQKILAQVYKGVDMLNERLPWKKVLAREGIDITTISAVDPVFIEAVREVAHSEDELFFTYFVNRSFTHYCGIDPKALGRYLQKTYFPDEQTIERYYEEGVKYLDLLPKRVREWKEKSVALNSSWDVLEEAFTQFRKEFEWMCRIYSIQSWLAIEAWQEMFDTELQQMIQKSGQEERAEEIIASVCTPWKKTALMEIQDRLVAGEDPDLLLKEYQCLRSWSAVWFRPLDRQWIEGLRAPASHAVQTTLSLGALVELLKPNSEQLAMIRLAPYLIFFKDWRDDLRRAQVYSWSFLFDEMARIVDLERADVGYFTLDEIAETLREHSFSHSVLEKRKSSPCIVTILSGENTIRVIPFSSSYVRAMDGEVRLKAMDVIKGSVAFPGVVRGRVRIVKTFHDIKKVEEGEILVANTTHPNYLAGMKKAAAFVTNEGGIISHAAIVAREMKKPCIVGTRTAMQLLKDGDEIEVDATQGVVRVV